MIGHFRDHARGGFKDYTTGQKLPGSNLNVVSPVVNDGAVGRFGGFGNRQHQPHAAAIEEGQVGSFEEELQAEVIAIERHGALKVGDSQRDLANGGHGCTASKDGAHGRNYSANSYFNTARVLRQVRYYRE